VDDSYRLRALKALTAHLKLIVHQEGVADYGGFDFSKSVFRGRTVYGEDDPKTMVSILEAPRPDVGQTVGAGEGRVEQWQLLVQGWCPDDVDNPTDPLYQMMQVVEMQLQKIIALESGTGNPKYPAMYMLGQTITSMSFGPGVVRPPTEGVSSKAFFYLPVRVGLKKEVG
jgi:hypothetical protein